MATRKRIGIFGGSFNPPHLGHVAICKTVLRQGMVGEVWVIPCYLHPSDKSLVAFEHRCEMCTLAFADLGKRVKVLDLEKKLGGKSYTIRTVETLQKKHPDCEFLLILGEDAAKEAKTWHRHGDLRKIISWLVVPRGPHSMVPDVSASKSREALQNGGTTEVLIPEKVLEYLTDHKLYR